jgi:undecaprenyl diphosphate synthase
MPSSAFAMKSPEEARYPAHVAIIMDGNGRWAEKNKTPRKMGHKAGAEALRRLLEACRNYPHLRYLTVYAFSSENWKREPSEIQDLMGLLRHYINHEVKNLLKENIRLRFIGDRQTLSADLQKDLSAIEKESATKTGLNLTIAISYGARQEMVHAMQRIASDVASGTLTPENISETTIQNYLATADLPDPDLLIRTGGDERLSNFLLWQSAYTELYFSEVLWPDFSATEMEKAFETYAARERRFGARND